MTKERIEIIRQSLIPFVKKKLLEINYEGLGKSDVKEFEKDLNEVLNLAIKALEQQPCDDCVSRKKVIKAIDKHTFNTDDGLCLDEDITIILEEIPPATPTQRWIPVSERLPEKMGTYLVTLEYKEHGKGITTLWYHGERFGWDLRVADVVIAWQPLPEPYKAETESEEC